MKNRKVLVVVASLLALSAAAWAALPKDRELGELSLIQKLNGSPVALGVAHSADAGATFSTCINTASPFDAGRGDLDVFSCTDPVFAVTGTCSTTATTGDRPVPLNTETPVLLKSSDMAIAFRQQDGGSSAYCYVGHMQ